MTVTTTVTAPKFSALGIGGHHSAASVTVEWGTPRFIIEKLGPFPLDPCAPISQPHPTAARTMTILDDGLMLPWRDADGRKERVWLNPPYGNGEIEKWLEKMSLHDFGTALIFARTETDAFFRYVWECASALLFMRGRVNFDVIEAFSVIKTKKTFLSGDRAKGNAGAPTVLCAYGMHDADILAACGIEGQFVPLRFPRSVLVEFLAQPTWFEVVRDAIASIAGDRPVRVADIWDAVRNHPKAAGKDNARAKVRQVLQLGAGVSVGRDQWVAPT